MAGVRIGEILDRIDTRAFRQADYAALFVWLLTDAQGLSECDGTQIKRCFAEANLNVPTTSHLRRALLSAPEVVRGLKPDSYRVHRDSLPGMRAKYGQLVITRSPTSERVLRERLDVSRTPFLEQEDIANAYKMAEIYVALHCLENSVRQLIRQTLSRSLGQDWWSQAASTGMIAKLQDRRGRERKNRWLSSRGGDELNYLDWADLVTLIRKFHVQFEAFIPEVKFLELKLEELENLRNTMAHSGVLPDEEVTRVELALRDWQRQVSSPWRERMGVEPTEDTRSAPRRI